MFTDLYFTFLVWLVSAKIKKNEYMTMNEFMPRQTVLLDIFLNDPVVAPTQVLAKSNEANIS